MILYGASGHGKVIYEILEDMGIEDIKIWDDAEHPKFWNINVSKPRIDEISLRESFIIGIGYNTTRKKVVDRLNNFITFGKAIHPTAKISKRAIIGEGTVVMAGAVVNVDTVIGKHCILNTSCSIDHDCILEDYVHISPNATLSGNVFVGEGTHIGSGAVSIQGIKIGKWCTIGAGTVIIRDIPDFTTVVGNPARVIRKEQINER